MCSSEVSFNYYMIGYPVAISSQKTNPWVFVLYHFKSLRALFPITAKYISVMLFSKYRFCAKNVWGIKNEITVLRWLSIGKMQEQQQQTKECLLVIFCLLFFQNELLQTTVYDTLQNPHFREGDS